MVHTCDRPRSSSCFSEALKRDDTQQRTRAPKRESEVRHQLHDSRFKAAGRAVLVHGWQQARQSHEQGMALYTAD